MTGVDLFRFTVECIRQYVSSGFSFEKPVLSGINFIPHFVGLSLKYNVGFQNTIGSF